MPFLRSGAHSRAENTINVCKRRPDAGPIWGMRTLRQVPDPEVALMFVAQTLIVIRSPVWWPGKPGF